MRFGEKTSQWKFVCPRCGNIQTPKDFLDVGLDKDRAAQLSYQDCIGRHTKEKGCDWAAYGLFGTLEKGRIVITPEGKEVQVFDFAK